MKFNLVNDIKRIIYMSFLKHDRAKRMMRSLGLFSGFFFQQVATLNGIC